MRYAHHFDIIARLLSSFVFFFSSFVLLFRRVCKWLIIVRLFCISTMKHYGHLFQCLTSFPFFRLLFSPHEFGDVVRQLYNIQCISCVVTKLFTKLLKILVSCLFDIFIYSLILPNNFGCTRRRFSALWSSEGKLTATR